MQFSVNAIRYTLAHLFQVAFPDYAPQIQINGTDISAQIQGINFRFQLIDEEKREKLLRHEMELSTLTSTLNHALPVCYVNNAGVPFTVQGKEMTLHLDFITLPFILLTRYEEINGARDRHQRFPYKESLAAHYHFIHIPLIDEYALLLREWTIQQFATITQSPRDGKLILTHDIDMLYRFGNTWETLRTIFGGDLIARHSYRMMHRSIQQYKRCHHDRTQDPYVTATIDFLKHKPIGNYEEWFFFKALCAGENDCTYDVRDQEVMELLQLILQNGKGIGLHGSYQSFQNQELIKREKKRLEEIIGEDVTHQRQHYLRFDAVETPGAWQAAGIQHDYTLGFAENEGFRCGTCHPFPLYDIVNDTPTQVIEHPLIAMDTTLIHYRELSTTEALKKLQELATTCQKVEGDFVLLWHNSTTEREYTRWFTEVYIPFVENQ